MTGEILSTAQMGEADKLAIAAGVPSLILMENAGRAVADFVWRRYLPPFVVVLCGPGNNGGDGFVTARLLRDRGCRVRVGLLGNEGALRGDAVEMAKRWGDAVEPLSPDLLAARKSIVVDALFGAGLTRPLDGVARDTVLAVNKTNYPVVAVDVPSGISGDAGRPLEKDGAYIQARYTVTFFRKKPAHLLLPGRSACGTVHVLNIGIANDALNVIRPNLYENTPALWQRDFPKPRVEGHKYSRGHALCVSGPAHATGAARLAARAALRVGAGLVSVASPLDAVGENATHLTAVMIKPFDGARALATMLGDKRLNAVVVGPGCGVGATTRDIVYAVLGSGAAAVLDADALTSFAGQNSELFAHINSETVMTPHEGEFDRLFPGLLSRASSRLNAAREAAALANCVVVLKGPDTVVAAPDGRASINANAPPYLATAGAGDVLAGLIAGLRAQGMSAFTAASAGVWLQGAVATAFGPGLIAEDLPERIPDVFRALNER